MLSAGSNSVQISSNDWEAWIREFWKPFGVKGRADSIHAIGINSGKLPEILRAARQAQDNGTVEISAWIMEGPAAVHADTWWEMYGPAAGLHPNRFPTDKHFGWYEVQPPDGLARFGSIHYACSEQFRSVVTRNKLSGLESLPVVTAQGADVKNWHEVFSTTPLGRGLDHPLLDTAKHEANLARKGLNPSRRWGERSAWGSRSGDAPTLVADLSGAATLLSDLMELAQNGFSIGGQERFVQEYLPTTDFAYKGWGWNDDTGPGAGGRPVRTICCNSRARRALLDSGLLRERDFEALWVVPEAKAGEGVKILDRDVPFPLPLPIYTPAELKVERAKREKAALIAVNDAKNSVKPQVPRTLKAAIAALKRAANESMGRWAPLHTDDALSVAVTKSRHAARLPRAWHLLLPFTPIQISAKLGPDDEREFDLIAPAWNAWLSPAYDDRPADEKPSKRDLLIAETSCGDWYSIRITEKQAPEDAPISLWNHETLSVEERWPNVRAFAGYLLLLAEHSIDRP